MDGMSGEFGYAAIPQSRPVPLESQQPYWKLSAVLARFRSVLPPHLVDRHTCTSTRTSVI